MSSQIMIGEMMVAAERALIAKNAARGWMAEQAAAHDEQAVATTSRFHAGRMLLRSGTWLRGVSGATPAGVLLTCRLASMK